MLVFKLKLTEKSVPWFEDHRLDVRAMESALSILFAEVEATNRIRKVIITIQVLYNTESSDYTFETNKIRLSDSPYFNNSSKKEMTNAIFDHFLHEFRHWMQSRIYKVSHTKINYTDQDVELNTNAYYKNEYEVDARQFSRNYLPKFYKYYQYFKKQA